ncbi:Rhs family protein [[Actinomadura] parvosata subsp. kistnae]|uniref:RHS repeat-associated core domain-containing protein n=1 Tax=[Actinomadura] parvosata subsp. kistnae TaxID=1909395 RepID=A0A1U9ZYB1_9ACTN|nr:RHS repeat-associated core domain-containing protein [Nonomuraea sp. ATCC 55076]AQZ62938.1 hypothetical protein BKM31_17030 [Nonomuraea sp. ATCC 55076]SPL95833.1 Rhs family protein [Actinomadura parvosata subsp. kistnae]
MTAWLIGLPTRTLSTGCTSAGECTTRESTFDYDGKGNPTVTVVEPNHPALKLTTTTAYGPFGVITSITKTDNAGRSRTDSREYNADQLYPTTTVNAANHRTVIVTHSGLGVPISTTDPNRFETTFRYDRFGRLRETNRSDGSFERITHTNLGTRQRTTTTVAGGGQTTELVDQLGRTRELRVTAFDGRTATTYTDHDPLGRGIWRTSRPALPGETPQYTVTLYDNRGRVTSVTAPDGAKVRHEYVNLETHTYDAKGVHSYTIDTVDGQADSRYEDDPNSATWLQTQFEYGPFGETTKITAPDKTAQTMHHDPRGRQTRLDDPSSGTTITTYNAFGAVASATDAENRTTTFTYDSLGRVETVTSPDGVATNIWDTADHGRGKLAQARSATGVTTRHTYNELSQAETTTWTIEGTPYEFRYGYDNIGRNNCITYPAIPGASGRLTVGHIYNSHGYLTQVKDGCEAGGAVYWAAEARNGTGQLERERLGNGAVSTRAYRPITGLLDRIVTTGPGTVGKVGEIAYDYDDNRNVRQRNDLVHQRDESYHHDTLNRLDGWSIQHTGVGQPVLNATYAYDSVGNLKTETVQRPNQPEENTAYRYAEDGAPPHALTSRDNDEYGYNRAGQQTSGPHRTVQYNTAGLPTVIDWRIRQGQPRQTAFAYDPSGARALKRDADQTTITVAGLFERRTPADTSGIEIHNLHNIVADGRVVAQVNRVQAASGGPVTNTWTWYLHADQQGSTTLTTQGNNQPTAQYYDPFGQRTDQTGKPLDNGRRDGPRQGYTGHEHDDEYGLIDMKGRIYDPAARRFLTPDPIQESVSSQSRNRYSYVENNPVTRTDPTGYLPQPHGLGNSLTQQRERFEIVGCALNPSPFQDCTALLNAIDDAGGPAYFSRTPTKIAVAATPGGDDDNSQVTIVEQAAVFRGSTSMESNDSKALWERAGRWLLDNFVQPIIVGGVEIALGGSTANTPKPGDRTYSRQTLFEHAINVVIAEAGIKIAGKTFAWAKGKLFNPGRAIDGAAMTIAGRSAGAGFGKAEMEQALAYANKEAKMIHILDKAGRGLDDLVKRAGGESAAIRNIVFSLADGSGLPAAGKFEVPRVVNEVNIIIRGWVGDGIPKIGTVIVPR